MALPQSRTCDAARPERRASDIPRKCCDYVNSPALPSRMEAAMACPFCGDVMTCWARGRYALQLCFGAGAPDERWDVWRCPTCGFVAVFRT